MRRAGRTVARVAGSPLLYIRPRCRPRRRARRASTPRRWAERRLASAIAERPARASGAISCSRCCTRCKRASVDQRRARSTTCASVSRPAGRSLRRRDASTRCFSTTPRPPRCVHVCDDIACTCAGADEAVRRARIARSARRDADARRSRDAGCAARASVSAIARRRRCSSTAGESADASVDRAGRTHGERAASLLDANRRARRRRAAPHVGGRPELRLLRRVGKRRSGEPRRRIARTAAIGRCAQRYRARPRARHRGGHRVETRSGAAARHSRRAQDASGRARAARPHYLVCNADESEPGTFKDRVLMEDDPFAIVEAMTIAAFADGLRARLHLHSRRVSAGARAHRRRDRRGARSGLLGDDMMGRGLRFDIEIRRGAGAYICGEETALFNSIEGKRGEPRNKPPFPVEVGPVRQADADQQRRDAREYSPHRARGRRRVRATRNAADRPERGSSASPAPCASPASTKCRTGPRSAR